MDKPLDSLQEEKTRAEEELLETQEEKSLAESDLVEEEYKIFEYFKEHTGLLVTCVSALVAIMSFLLHFAVGRMNYSYLTYWNISSLYANTSNQSELDMVVCAFLYIVALFLMHSFLWKTADVYQHYNKFLSVTKEAIKRSKKKNKQILQKMDGYSRIIVQSLSEEVDVGRAEEVKKSIDDCKSACEETAREIWCIKAKRRNVWLWVAVQIVISLILSYLFGSLFLFLLNVTTQLREVIQLTVIVGVAIVLDLIVYFVPAFFKTRCVGKKLTDGELETLLLELADKGLPEFPILTLLQNGFKKVLTDQNIKKAAGYSLLITAFLVIIIAVGGTLSAEKQQRFQIYCDGATSYAIVYTSDSTRFMEEAVISDKTITIDTSKQRIITSDDIAYTIQEFEEVIVNRIDGEKDIEQAVNSEKKTVSEE